ncbi:protein Abitram [Neocloeon triangulifer]|uniref:protein Abitram n=1 Tax=Neocloeon triangulifer TaxID=2078957 RepID=UPI00286EE4E9|nr:protein Abitram [Neocloeon triangulifer]
MGSTELFVAPPIEDSFERPEKILNVTERYYSPRYALNASGIEGEDLCILFHSNKICLVTLAPTHPILLHKKKIDKFNFEVSRNVDRLQNKVSGKGKHGAQVLQPSSTICFIECSDGTSYAICSCLNGKLVEINEKIIDEPDLVISRPLSEGYLAIVLPSIANSHKAKDQLLSQEGYEKARGIKSSESL